ncbi:MAG TPA: cobalamin-binding protein [Firmicutes bacterium]|nr:cobalamin-binding protein [Bacillota bacterium]
MSKIQEVKAAVETGKTKLIAGLVQEALDAGHQANDILAAMIDAMSTVGDKFSSGEIFVPEMLIAGKAMQKGVDVLKPHLAGEAAVSLGKCIIGTVAGDLHDIGKNLVALMIESVGFDVIDLGVDVSVAKFVDTIRANPDVKVVALSALLTTTMPAMKDTVAAIRDSGLSGFKIIVGGAPITQEFADAIGADAYARDAGGAAAKVKTLV